MRERNTLSHQTDGYGQAVMKANSAWLLLIRGYAHFSKWTNMVALRSDQAVLPPSGCLGSMSLA
jgi:hypothetical protein